MIGNRQSGYFSFFDHDDVAPALPRNLPSQRLEYADNLASAENGKRRRH